MRYAVALSFLFLACKADPSPPAPVASPSVADAPAPSSAPADLYAVELTSLDGETKPLADFRDRALLFVNTASQCGYTPQYEGLQALHETYGSRGLVVAGIPCNQFGGQEPGDAAAIKTFCTSKYGVEFPMFAKAKVNGPERHPLYAILTAVPDEKGTAGDVQWNFEKFLVHPGGTTIERFRSAVKPQDPKLVAAIEAALPRGS